MTKWISLAALLFGCAATTFAADPQLMNLVMPDAKVIGGVNVTAAKNSPLGMFLMSRLPAGLPNIPGFNPLQSVTEMIAASSANPAAPGGLLLMDGTFDSAAVAAAVAASTKAAATVSTYGGATLITFTNPKAKMNPAIAFIGTNIAIAGDAASVTAALDRSSGTNAIDPGLGAQVNTLSGAEDAWIASIAPPGSLIPKAAAAQAQQAAQFLTTIQGFSAGAKFGQNVPVTLDVVADTPQNAAALGNVVKLLLTMTSSSNPGLAQSLQSLQVNTNGATLDLSLILPESQLEALLSALPKPAAN